MTPERAQILVDKLSQNTEMLPSDEELASLDEALAGLAVKTAVMRHAGKLEETYTIMGVSYIQTGKDLTAVENLVVTGGSLIHTQNTAKIASCALYDPLEPTSLRPQRARILIDRKYIIASMGLLSEHYPEVALTIMKEELIEDGLAK